MADDPIIRFRATPLTKQLLDRLRNEKAVNVSAWLRNVVQRALKQELPDFADYKATETPETDTHQATGETEIAPEPDTNKTTGETEAAPDAPETDTNKTTIEGWKPRRLPGDVWGAVLEGPKVAELPDNDHLPGTPIRVTDKRDESWTTTLTEVVERTGTSIVVKNSGRPSG